MADCPNLVIWNPIPDGSRFCAEARGANDDFVAGVRIVGADGSETTFLTADLVPGPARRSLTHQSYGVRIAVTPGPTCANATVNAWVENEKGARIRECSWTAPMPVKIRRATLVLVPESSVPIPAVDELG